MFWSNKGTLILIEYLNNSEFWNCPKTSRSGPSSSLYGFFVCRGVVLDTRLSGNDCTKEPIMTPLHETYIWCRPHFAASPAAGDQGAGQDWKSHSAIISSRFYFQPGHSAHFLKLLLEFHRILKTVSRFQFINILNKLCWWCKSSIQKTGEGLV